MINKKLEDIVPAKKGVKLKSKRTKKKENVQLSKPTIKKNVTPFANEEISLPSQEAVNLESKNIDSQSRLIKAMKSINRLMNVQTLPENKSYKQSEEEKKFVSELVSAVMEIETISPSEGIIAMATLAIRQGLSLRDAGNRLAYNLKLIDKRISNLERKITDDKSSED